MSDVRTRIAPSPTGEDLHIGNLYTALINWAFARKNHGQFIVRIEDTDQERLIEGSEDRILSTLEKYGLNYDEGPDKVGSFAPYRQSERLELYKKYAEELVKEGRAYYCFCSKEKLEALKSEKQASERHFKLVDHDFGDAEKRISSGEKYVIRLKVPEKQDVIFNDLIRGQITINTDQIDDQILIKSDGFPTYHMAVVVDDHLMNISHVIRAEEWISSTPKHVLIYQTLGWELPVFVHLPILRNSDKSKLSKRRNPVWASWYLKEGFLPDAVLNYLALMGWSHPEGKEIFSIDEFIEKLNLQDIKAAGPSFDPVKLEWMNGEYIRKMSDEELTQKLQDYLVDHPNKDQIGPLVPLIKERIKKLSDFVPLTDFIFDQPEYDKEVFLKVVYGNEEKLREGVQAINNTLNDLSKPWKSEEFEKAFRDLAEKLGLSTGEMFQLLRVVVSGQLVTPPLFESIKIIGEDEILSRAKVAVDIVL